MDFDVYGDVILPGFIALLVSLLTIYVNNLMQARKKFENDIVDSCKKIIRIIFRNEPAWYEEDFLVEVNEIKYLLDRKNYLKKECCELLKEKIKNIKYQFADLTLEGVPNAKMSKDKEAAAMTISEIRYAVETNSK